TYYRKFPQGRAPCVPAPWHLSVCPPFEVPPTQCAAHAARCPRRTRNQPMRWKRAPRLLAAALASMLISAVPMITSTQAASAASSNLALGKTMSSSGYNQTYAPGNADDGNQASYWESTNNAFPQWLEVDLGASTQVNQVVLQLPNGWGTRTETLSVQGSTDNSNFTTIVASTGYAFD